MGFCSGGGFWNTGAFVVQCSDYKTPWVPPANDDMMPGYSGEIDYGDDITGEIIID